MTVNDFLEIYREEQAPILGRDYIDGFIARNRASLVRMIEPVVALINARAAKAAAAKRAEADDADGVLTIRRAGDHRLGLAALSIRIKVDSFAEASRQYRHYVDESGEGASTFPTGRLQLNGRTYEISYNGRVWEVGGGGEVYTPPSVEDPDAVTPEKDAIVWAAFMGLVNEKRRAIGMEELEVTESLPFGGKSVGRIRDRGWGSEVAADKLTARSREMADTRHNVQTAGDHAAWSRRVSAKVGAVLAARKRRHASPGSREAGLALESAEASLARELGGKDHITLAIETYRWEQEQEQRRIGRNDEDVESLPAKLSTVEERLVGELVAMGMPRRDARYAVVQTREHNVERRLARMSPEERGAEHARNAEMFSRVFGRSEGTESLPAPGGRTPIAITLRHPERRDLTAMVTASASEPGRFQLTWVDDEGPSGHTTRDTPEEAVRYAVDEGYRLDSANTAEARAMVERVERARTERAAKIESWLTESLPSRGTCGRTPKERRQAEHIAESYEDRGLDARTSKSRGCATVNARRNERMESLPVKLSEVEEGLVNELVAMGTPRRDARIAVIQTREDNVERRRARMSPAELRAEYAINAELLGSLSHRRAESIESLPKNVGRKGDGFRVGEHVIRIGDMIKMEGQLGGYVRSVDRSKGTAVIEQDNDEVKTWPIASLLHDTAANRQRQQDYNDKLAADAEAKLELSLADWRAQ